MKELAVQKYLRSGKSLINLNQDYKINFVINSEDNSVVLNYSPNTPIETDIGRESRALILDLDNWDVIAKSMDAFLIPSSLKTAEKIEYFDWNNAFATPKYDGCLMLLYFIKNEWKIGTRFSTDSMCNVYSPNAGETEISWKDVFISTLEEYGYSFEEFKTYLNKENYYSFELCSRFNRNIVIYEEQIIKLLTIVSSETLEELDIDQFKLREFIPERIKVSSLDEVKKLIDQNNNPLECEGFVVVDSKLNRIKVKNEKYTELGFINASTNEAKVLKDYAITILTGPSLTEWYCVTCNPNPGFGSPSVNCTEVPVGENLVFPPESNCTITGPYPTSVDCSSNCLGIDGDEGGPLSIQSSKMCSTSWNPKKQSSAKSVELVNSFVSMLDWFSNSFVEFKRTNNESISDLLISIWEYAFFQMESGKSISEIINSSSEVDQILALEKFEQLVK
jgi:hypothetical protein